MASNKRRMVELGMVPPAAAELAAQIDGTRPKSSRALMEMGIVTALARALVAQMNAGSGNQAALIEASMVPLLAKEIAAQIGGGTPTPTPTPILDGLPAATWAWAAGDILKTGSTPLIGTPTAITAVNDQVGTNNATPVNFTAVATDQVNGKNYLGFAATEYLSLASPISLTGDFTIAIGVGFTATTGARAILGREGFSSPYIRMTRNSINITGTDMPGSWDIGVGFHAVVITRTGTAVTVYVDGEQWATGTSASTLAAMDRIGRNQTGNNFRGGIGALIGWDGVVLSGSNLDTLTARLEAAWRSPIYISGAAGNNANAGWSDAQSLANFDLYNVASGYLALRPGSRIWIKYGAQLGRSPLYIIQSNQAGSAAKPNSIAMYGNASDGAAYLDFTNDLSGLTWTVVTGTKYSAPLAYNGAVAHWRKPGYSPMAFLTACRAAYAAAKTAGSGNVDFSTALGLIQKITPAASAAAVGLNQFFTDGTTITIDIGTDPNGKNIRLNATNGITMSTGRTMQVARNYWNTGVWLALEGATEDGIVYSGSNCNLNGESKDRPLLSIGAGGDTVGGKGGSSNEGRFVMMLYAGIGTQLTGSNGDGASWHGGASVALYDCEAYLCGKSGFDHEQGTTVSHTRCITAGCYQPWQVLNQGGGTGAWSYTDCEAILQSTDAQAMFQLLSTLGGTATFSGGYYRGNASAPVNTFIRGGTGNTMNATGQANRTGFTTDIANAGSGSMVVAT